MLRRSRIVITRMLLLDTVILADLMASYSKPHIQTFHTTVPIRELMDCGDSEKSREGIHCAFFNSEVSDQNQLLCNKKL
jgi:hypothetical protein